MKRTILLIVTVMLVSMGSLIAQQNHQNDSKGIKFYQKSWKQVLKKAKEENKPIFVDMYAVWCGPCKLLQKNTFPNEKAGEYFNHNFINVSVDAEKGEGIALAKKLGVTAYPSLYILNSNGVPVVYTTGFLRYEELIELGKAGLKTLKNKF